MNVKTRARELSRDANTGAGKARLSHLRQSPQKVRLVANMVRGKRVEEALGILTLSTKAAARPMKKLLDSAVANADDISGGKADVDSLWVKSVQVDGGPIIKRWMPRAMGRANRINHRTSHITVVLDDHPWDARASRKRS